MILNDLLELISPLIYIRLKAEYFLFSSRLFLLSLRYFAFYRQHSFSATISFSLLNSYSLLTFHLIAFSISHFLREPGLPILVTNELLCDNLSAVMLTANLAFHSKTKHFELNHHYMRERESLLVHLWLNTFRECISWLIYSPSLCMFPHSV